MWQNWGFVKDIFEEQEINYIIHTAALKYIDTCELFLEILEKSVF